MSDHNAKLGISYHDYRRQIREIATRAAVVRLLDGDEHEYLHRAIDGHEFIIYTNKALCILIHTSNDDAGFEELGRDFLVGADSMSDIYTRAAYWAMIADIRDQDPDPDVTVTLSYTANGQYCYLTLPYSEIVNQIDALREKYENLNCDD